MKTEEKEIVWEWIFMVNGELVEVLTDSPKERDGLLELGIAMLGCYGCRPETILGKIRKLNPELIKKTPIFIL